MRAVRSKNTRPEMIVRRTLHALGYRFRLHAADLPGKPDIVLPGLQSVIFVHGCFWHGHSDCKRSKRPATNIDFWNRKLDSNIKRDAQQFKALETKGWRLLVIWQCELRDREKLISKLRTFLDASRSFPANHRRVMPDR